MITIDIGNSRIKAGFFNGIQLEELQRFIEPEAVIPFIEQFPDAPVVFSSVHPEKTEVLLQHLKSVSRRHYQVTHDSKFSFTVAYQTPETLGMDRLCGLEGAIAQLRADGIVSGFPLLTVDAGTATTINYINEHGEFEGGLIMPGIALMFESLYKSTAQLPLVPATGDIPLIGSSTHAGIQSGVVHSTVAIIEKFLREIAVKGAGQPQLFLTGGNSTVLFQYFTFARIVPHLTLMGLHALGRQVFTD